ncbi:hypothetical protein K438DRAFT_2057277 [Mycena galopus ATCC 62051]|nr:hypothetical protein K438DRAFT_2057277 [Mycena galopus ATCC 62051]
MSAATKKQIIRRSGSRQPHSLLAYNSHLSISTILLIFLSSQFQELQPVLMFSFFTSSALPGVVAAVLSSLAVVNALCLPCQVGLDSQIPLSLKTPSSALTRRGVYSPPITSPDASTTWTRNTSVTVTWCAASPARVSNPTGSLLLGYLEPGSSNEHLNLGNNIIIFCVHAVLTIWPPFRSPTCTRFSLRDGNRTITVPDVPPDYIS